jgi:hypothetical protein
MAISRAERRRDRRPRVVARFGDELADAVLNVLELTELAWHDCYKEITPSEEIVDEILLCSQGDLVKLIGAARLAVIDWRDLRLWADSLRGGQPPPAI